MSGSRPNSVSKDSMLQGFRYIPLWDSPPPSSHLQHTASQLRITQNLPHMQMHVTCRFECLPHHQLLSEHSSNSPGPLRESLDFTVYHGSTSFMRSKTQLQASIKQGFSCTHWSVVTVATHHSITHSQWGLLQCHLAPRFRSACLQCWDITQAISHALSQSFSV